MIPCVNFTADKSVRYHIDNPREASAYLCSLFAHVSKGEPYLEDLDAYQKFRYDAERKLEEVYGPDLELQLIDAEDTDSDADESSDVVIMLITSKVHREYVEH